MASNPKSKITSAKNKPIAKKSMGATKTIKSAKPAASASKATAKKTPSKIIKSTPLKKPAEKAKMPAVKSQAKPVKKISVKVTVPTKHSSTRVITKKSAPKKTLKSVAKPKVLLKNTSPKKISVKTPLRAKTTNSVNKTRSPKIVETPKVTSVNQPVTKSSVPPAATHAQQLTELMGNHPDDYMNDEHKRRFQQILIDWKQQLLQEMERTVHHLQDDAASFADPNDRATQEEEFNLELRTRDRELKLIKKIEEALQRLQNSDYGYCEACGVEIGLPRLVARPTATLCIDCKAVAEMQEKPYV